MGAGGRERRGESELALAVYDWSMLVTVGDYLETRSPKNSKNCKNHKLNSQPIYKYSHLVRGYFTHYFIS